ncbi:MAG: rhodanese-like domain-containing protein [Filomicrobium sp.]|nr:rhodanese-like domain-containing protein [Filomicrobium sp.]
MLWRVVDRVSLVSVTIGLIVFTASASASATGVGFGRTADVTAPKAVALQPERMLATETMVRRRFPDVLHLSSEGLAQRLSGKSGVLLLDVREADEFAVGHLPNSIRVDPNIPTDAFLQRYSSSVRGKMVVFYCSVGMRSSALAQRVQRELFAAGADRVYNLNGGIFHWHNEERGLVDGRGATSLVHKYDDTWGQLVRRSALAVSRPAPKN